MDNREAERILDEQLANYVQRGFDLLAGLVAARSVETKEALGSSGAQ